MLYKQFTKLAAGSLFSFHNHNWSVSVSINPINTPGKVCFDLFPPSMFPSSMLYNYFLSQTSADENQYRVFIVGLDKSFLLATVPFTDFKNRHNKHSFRLLPGFEQETID